MLTVVMLNPSTADATHDDPTIRRCIGFAKTARAEGLRVVNFFALRSTDPDALANADDPVGPMNDEYTSPQPGKATEPSRRGALIRLLLAGQESCMTCFGRRTSCWSAGEQPRTVIRAIRFMSAAPYDCNGGCPRSFDHAHKLRVVPRKTL